MQFGDITVNIPKEVVEVLNAPDSVKILATADEKGMPNAVPVYSIVPIRDDTVAFAEIFIMHTKQNLAKNKNVNLTVFKASSTAYQLKGTFDGFQTSGQLFDNFAKKMAERKMPMKSVGLIKINKVFAASPGQGSKKLA
jgi:predicted pyridoxine 5'-phosphate oxidase superfamily flavin-nucleotide-binding protein